MGVVDIKPFAFDRRFNPLSDRRASNALDLEIELDSLREQMDRMERDRDAALAQARADGFQAGLTQARTERDAALLAAVDALHAGVEQLGEEFAGVTESVTRDAAQVALAAADLIAGRALAADPTLAIDAALGRVLAQVGRGPHLVIRVHPGLVADMERLVAARIAAERRRMTLVVVGDDTLAIGDAAIIWDEGGLAFDAAARRAMIVDELGALLA